MFSTEEFLKITGGKLLQKGKHSTIKNISIDSRNIPSNSLFIPIIGKKLDGHKFIINAIKNGAVATLTSKKIKLPKDKTVILVKDTEKALHQISKAYKERFDIPFIGITGSSGKTTTKDMLASILSLAGKTLKTEENYNNEIGVPLTLFKLNKKHKFCVIEMAMQAIGEIEELAWIVRPQISIITNIGDAHIGLLKNMKNIAGTKSEILNFHKRSDTAVLPYDDEYFDFLKSKVKCKILTFGLVQGSDIRAENIINRKNGVSFDLIVRDKKTNVNLPIPGNYNILDALAAAAAANKLGINSQLIKKGLERFKLSSKRMEITEHKGIRIINDSYNANPSSMKSSLEILKNQLPVTSGRPPRRIAILGDMLELGRFTTVKHIELGKIVSNFGIDKLFTVGKLGKLIAKGAKLTKMKDVVSLKDNRQVLSSIKRMLRPNDVVLVKGSRGMKMEEIAEGLKKHG